MPPTRPRSLPALRLASRLLAPALGLGLAACATPAGEMVGKALETVGMKAPEAKPDLSLVPFVVPLRVHAGENLNAGTGRTPLSLAVRIYELKDAASFLAAPYEAFLDPQKEKEALGADLIESREVLLIPGQRYEVIEKQSRAGTVLGIAALFQKPAAGRWKVAFDAEKAQTTGIFVGALACSLTVTRGVPVQPLPPAAGSRCE